jgi:hypothetical protein
LDLGEELASRRERGFADVEPTRRLVELVGRDEVLVRFLWTKDGGVVQRLEQGREQRALELRRELHVPVGTRSADHATDACQFATCSDDGLVLCQEVVQEPRVQLHELGMMVSALPVAKEPPAHVVVVDVRARGA